MSHPVDYRSHVNTVIGLLEDNRPLDESDSSGRAGGFTGVEFFDIFYESGF